MHKILLAILLFPIALHCGVSDDTKIETENGTKEARELKKGDLIATLGQNGLKKMKKIESIDDVESDECVKTTLNDGTQLRSSKNQMIYIPARKAWLPVTALLKGDKVMKHDNTELEIIGNEVTNEKLKLRFMVIDKNHNFFAENGIVMHNGPVGAKAGWTIGAGGTWLVFEGAYIGIGAVAGFISGPAAPIVGPLVRRTVSVACSPIQKATMLANGLAMSIWLGVASGPV